MEYTHSLLSSMYRESEVQVIRLGHCRSANVGVGCSMAP